MQTFDLSIAGMTCGHCVRTVSAALARIPDLTVEHVAVGHARVRHPAPAGDIDTTLRQAVEAAGYVVVAVEVSAAT
jgi:copper chaperone CopZ